MLAKNHFAELTRYLQLGIDRKEKAADELTETVEVVEEPVDEEQQIQDEVRFQN